MALPMRNQQRPQPHNHNDSERNASNNANIPRGAVKLQPRMNRGNAMPPQPSHTNNAVRRPQPPLRRPLNENNNADMHQPPLRIPRNMNANHNVNNMNGNQNNAPNGSFLSHNPNPERRENIALRRNVGRKELNKLEQNPRVLRTDIPQVTPSNTNIQNTMIDDNLDFGADDDAIELCEIDMNSNQMLPPSNTPPPDYYDDKPDDGDENSSYDDDIDDDIDYDAPQNNANNIDNMSDDELFNDSEKPASASSHDISLKPSVNASTPPVPSIPSAIPVPQPNPEIPDVNINNVSKNDEENTPETNQDDSENKKSPVSSFMNVFKSKANDFIRKAKNEIGDSRPDDDDENEDDDKDSKDEKSDEFENESEENKPENDSNNNEDKDKEEKKDNPDKPSVNRSNGVVSMIISIITLPFRMMLFIFNTATQLIRIMLSLVSALTVFILIWLICNIPAAMNQSVPSFDTDEGTLTAKEVSYDSNMITFKAENSSDMIAHAGITADVKAWKPFKKIPVSIFAPIQVQSCESTYVDINPGESKEITLKCTGDSGLWMRPQVHLTGE